MKSRISSLKSVPIAVFAVAALCASSIAWTDHGGRDRTERDVESRSARAETHDVSRDGSKSRDTQSGRTDGKSDRSGDGKSESSTGKDTGGKDGGGKSDDSKSDKSRNGSSGGSNSGRDDQQDGRSGAQSGASPRIDIERSADGHERRRSEVLFVGRRDALAAIRNAGYLVRNEQALGALGEILARIQVADNESVEQALQALKTLTPEADFAPNHIFRPSQSSKTDATTAVRLSHAGAAEIGVIDTGASNESPRLARAIVRTADFADGGYTPREHGTVVADIAARGGARLAVADVFGIDAENNLIAAADALARAIDWMLSEQVALMNISIEGPDNVVLAHVIRRAIGRGAIIVAAAGNNGPAAAPAFPAAYPDVIAVTAIDEMGRVYPRANRGDYVAFAALGVRVPVSDSITSDTVSGTSFAAPVVTAEIARRLRDNAKLSRAQILADLQRDAIDVGTPGRDPIFGWGIISAPRPRTAVAH